MNTLIRMKQLVLRGSVVFTEKARIEMDRDGITVDMVFEAIMNAPGIV